MFIFEKLCLDIQKDNYIAVVGAGGKTTLVFMLARELKAFGKTVIVTTSTNISEPDDVCVITGDNKEEIAKKLVTERIVVVGESHIDKKLKSPVDELFTFFPEAADFVLVEADGAKGKPIKAPEYYEPVIPGQANTVIGVVGLDCIGGRICDVCHRPHKVCEVLQTGDNHIMTKDDVAIIADSACGLRKGVGDRKYIVVLNKADDSYKENIGKIIESKIKSYTVVMKLK